MVMSSLRVHLVQGSIPNKGGFERVCNLAQKRILRAIGSKLAICLDKACWFSGMILVLDARDPGFNSRTGLLRILAKPHVQ